MTQIKFVLKEGIFISSQYIKASAPKCSILGPFIYLIYTADIPTKYETHTSIIADDIAIQGIHVNL